MELKIGQCSLQGVRDSNEDALQVMVCPTATLCVVADGGPAGGRLASETAVSVLCRLLNGKLQIQQDRETVRAAIRSGLIQAHDSLLALQAQEPSLRGLGSTVVLAVWSGGPDLFVVGLGDSRAYLVRGFQIEQLTTDHSGAGSVQAVTVTPEESVTWARSWLYRYLGCSEISSWPEVRVIQVQTGDRCLLCTDGLHGAVDDQELLRFIKEHPDPQHCAEALCQLALERGSRDNVSCIVVAVE